jgi:Uma2 family endonuclease
MDILVTEPDLKRKLLRRRKAWGQDHHDEVWNGVYVMSPLANNEHQRLVARLYYVLQEAFGFDSPVEARTGVNVSDRNEGWEKNFRVPDVVVRLPGGVAQDRGEYWLGGPDFVIEVASRGDRSRKKRPFYAKIGVREMMVVDRDPWAVELYRLAAGELKLAGKSTLEDSQSVASEVVPLSFRLVADENTPRIEVVHRQDGRRWLV